MSKPLQTRLRYITAKSPDAITAFLSRLKFRVQIYEIVWDGKAWFCWVVPPDDSDIELNNTDLRDLE